MPNEKQYQDRIDALEARVAELTLQLEKAHRELDEARMVLAHGSGSPQPADSPEPAAAQDSLCAFCDGEGVYWVHDFEMVCRRCNGTGHAAMAASSAAKSDAP